LQLIEEEEAEATVGQFLATWGDQNPQSAQKILGKAAKYLGGLVVGAAAGAAATAATGGIGAIVGAGAGAAAGAKLGEEAVNQLFGLIAEKSGALAKFMITMSEQQVPDDQRTGIANYYDLDDEYEALLQGMDSDLANEYQKHLFGYFKEAFERMENADPEAALSDYLEATANQYLEHFLFKRRLSGVGVIVKSQVSEEIEEANAVEFVNGKRSYEQACYEDPNCRELHAKKKKIKISISSLAVKELEEISTAGGVAAGQTGKVEGSPGSPWIKLRKKKRKDENNEQLVNEIMDYLVKNTGA